MAQPGPSLALVDVSKRFGAVHALRGVSFELEPGVVMGYLGPNGAGKTTTLRVILGLVRPDTGAVRVFGRPAADPAARVRVGSLPGELRLWAGMTGRQVIDHFARYRPGRPPRLRAELLGALQLDDATLRRRIKHLSHGTRQKLGLVIALQHDPELLLLDEPSLGLDPLVQHAFLDVVRMFAARGRAVLFSSHVLAEVQDVCTRVAIVRAGAVVALDSVDTLRLHVVRAASIRFRDAVPAGLEHVPGVQRVEIDGRTARLRFTGSVDALVQRLADAGVDDLVFPEPRLEDLFMSYYGVEPADA
jgi:ABC-2 type transport system ATP-binding protein